MEKPAEQEAHDLMPAWSAKATLRGVVVLFSKRI